MLPLTRSIIVPLADPDSDLERASERALGWAGELASRSESTVILYSAIAPVDASAARIAEREGYLRQLADSIDAAEVRSIVEVTDAETGILDIADSVDDPIVVMASHGRRGVERLTMGGVATAVARHAVHPVIVIPAGSGRQPASEQHVFQRILLQIGAVEQARALVDALLRALPIDRSEAVELNLLEVTPPITPRPGVVASDRYAGSHEPGAHTLHSVVAQLRQQGFTATWDLRIGDVAEETARLAAEYDVDMLAMPAGGNVVGLMARQVASGSAAPVLLLPERGTPISPRQRRTHQRLVSA